MLIENLNTKPRAEAMLKDSKTYINVAKFVEAYNIILADPNEFLKEVHLPLIDDNDDKLSWNSFVYIMQKCDFGFGEVPTKEDLLVYYNYALEIGTINKKEQKIATTEQIADCQKHYYNFIEETHNKVQEEYDKQKKKTKDSSDEAGRIDNQFSTYRIYEYVSAFMMVFATIIGLLGVFGLFFEIKFVNTLGSIFSEDKANYFGGAILITLGLIVFAIFDRIFVKTKLKASHLLFASDEAFEKMDEIYEVQLGIKHKLKNITQKLETAKIELADPEKRADVEHNIEQLKSSNKYYQAFHSNEQAIFKEEFEQLHADDVQALEAVPLSKEERENMNRIAQEAIILEGVIDADAYNEKFEKSRKERNAKKKQENDENLVLVSDAVEESQEKNAEAVKIASLQAEIDAIRQEQQSEAEEVTGQEEVKLSKKQQKQQEKLERELREQQQKEMEEKKLSEEEMLESLNHIKDMLGFDEEELEREK